MTNTESSPAHGECIAPELACDWGRGGPGGRMIAQHVVQREVQRLNEQTRNALASEFDEEHLPAAHAIGREMTFLGVRL